MKTVSSQILFSFLGLFAVVSARYIAEESARKTGSTAEVSAHDLLPSESGHVKKWEKGGGDEHRSLQHSSQGERGNKGFTDHHHYKKEDQGHESKKEDSGHYSLGGGQKKHYADAGGHYNREHYEDKGEKGNRYKEKSGHKKGHSTKGTHDVHILNEYKKNKEFFDEDYEAKDFEKHGGYERQTGSQGKGFKKLAHHNSGFDEGLHGHLGHFNKGLHYLLNSGEGGKSGFHEYFNHGEQFGKKRDQGNQKSWSYFSGHY